MAKDLIDASHIASHIDASHIVCHAWGVSCMGCVMHGVCDECHVISCNMTCVCMFQMCHVCHESRNMRCIHHTLKHDTPHT